MSIKLKDRITPHDSDSRMNVRRVQNKVVMIHVCLRCMHVLKVYVCVLHKGALNGVI